MVVPKVHGKKAPKWRLSVLIPVVVVVSLSINFSLTYTLANRNQTTGSDHHETIPKYVPTKKRSQKSSPTVVAHVVSLIKCGKKSSVTGFLDAAAVLRHSIHKQSVHGTSQSKYSYKMYAIVHEECKQHAAVLESLGYTALVRPTPVRLEEIQPGWYQSHVEGENCCGSKEFIKLYAYVLTDHEIVVHWDMDVAIFKPMDDLFDAMLFPADSQEGKLARSRLQVQHRERVLPDKIDAFFTRDITSSEPDEIHQGVQGGFLVARSSVDDFNKYLEFIKEANYTKGRGNNKGWGSLGYGGFQGAMAYQGVVAYFYDQVAPGRAVDLDACVWNQVVADVVWRGPHKMQYHGQCREYPRPGDTHEDNTPEKGRCRDCRVTPTELVNSAHYTACKKPWECRLPTPRIPRNKAQQERLNNLTNITTCGLLFRKWFDLRDEVESSLERAGGPKQVDHTGSFHPEYFGGYCSGSGAYIPMNPPPQDFDISKIYGSLAKNN